MLSQTARDRSVDVWNIIEHTFLSLHSCAMVVIFPCRNRCGLFDYSLRLISILLTTRNLWSRSPPKHGETARANCSRSRRLTLVWSGYHPTEPPPALPHYRERLAFSCLPRLGDCGWLCRGGQMVNELLCWSNTTCLCWVCEKHDIKACLSLPKFVVMNNVKACEGRSLKSSWDWV